MSLPILGLATVAILHFARVDFALGNGHHALGKIFESLKFALGFCCGWHDQSRYRVAARCQSGQQSR
jgi:hypothetical protein